MLSLPARPKRVALVIALLALALGSSAFVYKRMEAKPKPVEAKSAPELVELAPNDLITVVRKAVPQTVPLAGTLGALKQVQINAPYDGRIVEVLVRPGDRVSAGQVLARFDEADLRARLAERRAALTSAEEQMRVAERTRDSNRALLDRSFISKNAFDNTLGDYAQRQATLDAQRAQLAMVERALRDARLIAPLAGSVATRNAEPGQWVEPNRKLFSIIDLRHMEIEASIPSQHLAQLAIGQQVSFKAEGYGDQVFSGTLVRINPGTQAGTRSVLAYVAVDNPDERLRAGLYASGHAVVGNATEEIHIPQAALQKTAQGEGVWLVQDKRLNWRSLKVERVSADQLRVTQGLQGGEQLVSTPLKTAAPGQAVRLAAAN